MAESAERLCIGIDPTWCRLPAEAVRLDDVNALATEHIHAARAQTVARALHRHPAGGQHRQPLVCPPFNADAESEIWTEREHAMPPTIGCYFVP